MSDPAQPAAGRDPERLGHYRILRKIAEGGMGAVYEAEQESPRRVVALKVIRPGHSTAELLRRFEHEAEILGRLHHPGIAQIYEAGSAETAVGLQPYFAMELVAGVPLTQFVDEHALDVRARLELFGKVCDAVHHAHQKGVIHRDLKPANILVTAEGQPKVLDFGVARATDSDIKAATMRTDIGQLLGTLPYMSPEQVAADSTELDTRSDVYALGVILYELLAGKLPYELHQRMLHEAVRTIREVEPTRLGTVDRQFRGDLENIVTKALEKDKERRYGSAAELGTDVQRFLRDEPIDARSPSAIYQVRRFARRNKTLVGGLALVFVVAVIGAAVSAWQAVRARAAEHNAELGRTAAVDASRLAERNAALAREAEQRAVADRKVAQEASERAERNAAEARTEAAKAAATNRFLTEMLGAANAGLQPDRDVKLRTVLDEAANEIERGSLGDQPQVEAAVRRTLSSTYSSIGEFERAETHLKRALELWNAMTPAQPLEVADCRNDLGELCLDTGRFAEAETEFRAALEVHEQLSGKTSGPVSGDLIGLASARYNLGHADEALELSRAALAMRKQVYGERSIETAVALHSLAFHVEQRREYDEALKLLEESASILTEKLGESSPRAGRNYLEQGRLLSSMRATGRADAALLRAEEIFRKAYGDEHPNVALVLNERADSCISRGKAAEGEPLAREAVEILRKSLGDHRDTAVALTTLGEILAQQKRWGEAEEQLREALAMRVRVFGERSIAVGDSTRRLGDLYFDQGDLDKAEPLLRQGIEIWSETLGPEHPDLSMPMSALAKVCIQRGDLAQAETLLRHALELRERSTGPLSGDSKQARDALIEVLLSRRDWPAAEALARSAVELYAKDMPAGHPLIGYTQNQLGSALIGQGRFAEAEPLVLAGWNSVKDNPKLWAETKRIALERVIQLYEGWGKTDAAAEYRPMLAQFAK